MEDEDTGRKDACDPVSSPGRFYQSPTSETTKMLAHIMTKFLGPNPTRDALRSLCVVLFIKKTDPAFHD